MKRRSLPIAAALFGLALLVWGIFDGTYRDLMIAGAILMTGALLAECQHPPA
jgi:hypothetical protein